MNYKLYTANVVIYQTWHLNSEQFKTITIVLQRKTILKVISGQIYLKSHQLSKQSLYFKYKSFAS